MSASLLGCQKKNIDYDSSYERPDRVTPMVSKAFKKITSTRTTYELDPEDPPRTNTRND